MLTDNITSFILPNSSRQEVPKQCQKFIPNKWITVLYFLTCDHGQFVILIDLKKNA